MKSAETHPRLLCIVIGAMVVELYGKKSTSKYANVQFDPGDRVLLITPGGGGYGNPRERDRAKVAEGLRAGLITPEAAARLMAMRRQPRPSRIPSASANPAS